MKTSLNRIIDLENEEMWKEKIKPVIDEGIYSSHIDMDIWTVRLHTFIIGSPFLGFEWKSNEH